MTPNPIAFCRSLPAGDSALGPLARVLHRLRAGSYSFPLRILWAGLLLASTARALSVGGLRVEDLDRPLAIDEARPRFAWVLQSDQRAQRQAACQVRVASSPEILAAGKGDLWDTGKVASADNFGLEYAGPALHSGQRCFWQVRVWDAHDQPSAWSEVSWWQMAPMAATDWSAKWIGAAPEAGSPLLRREFQLGKKIVRATAHAYAAGWYRLFVNGTEITERVLSPVNSNYPKGLFYDTYDVTSLVRAGGNALGLWFGHGYSQGYSKYGYRWDQPPMGFLQVEILFSDGSTQRVVTDDAWKWAASPVTANDIYNGETYDARRESAGWNRPGFDDRDWKPVVLRDAPAGPLKACPFPGLAIVGDIKPVGVTEPKPGVFVFDLGQNIAGWVRLQARGPAGTELVLRHAEEIHPDGSLDVTTNRLAKATDTYTTAGRDEETYEPRFTYHGFRYVELTGYPGKPTLQTVTGRVVRAAVPEAGSFRSSDALLNRMHSNFKWSIAGNLVGIPTDTPSRDERTPCQMDSLAVEDAAICNFVLGPYYTKWLNDISGDGGNLPNWTGDQVLLPFRLYWNYGDRRILERHFDNMKQVVDKFTATAEESKHWAEGYGDWCAPNADGSYERSFSEGELVNRAFHYLCAETVAATAAVLGRPADATRYATLAQQLRVAFAARFYQPATATYGSGRQVTSVLPLAFGLAAPEDREAIVSALRRRIVDQDRSHPDTGIFGTRYLFKVLGDHGLADLAYQVLMAPGYPGYADQISRGATTTWEQWSFRGGMQTHNHAMFSGADATLFSHFGGIRPAAPGFREIEIKPTPPAGLAWVECSRDTPMGRVSSRWQREDRRLNLRVEIPANATARVWIPGANAASVLESGRPASKAEGALAVRTEDGHAVFTVGSGTYEFSTPLNPP